LNDLAAEKMLKTRWEREAQDGRRGGGISARRVVRCDDDSMEDEDGETESDYSRVSD
jgi:hypothetical protein